MFSPVGVLPLFQEYPVVVLPSSQNKSVRSRDCRGSSQLSCQEKQEGAKQIPVVVHGPKFGPLRKVRIIHSNVELWLAKPSGSGIGIDKMIHIINLD